MQFAAIPDLYTVVNQISESYMVDKNYRELAHFRTGLIVCCNSEDGLESSLSANFYNTGTAIA